MKTSRIFMGGALLLLPFQARAENSGVGTTSATFLKLGSSARPAALGEAYVSLADDQGGVAYNPAGMLNMNQNELQATHTSWFKGVNYEQLGVVLAIRPGNFMGFNFSYFGLPSQPRTVATGANSSDPLLNFKDVGTFSPYDMHLGVAYAKLLGTTWKTGASLNVTSQSVAGATAMGLGLDLGLVSDTGIENLNWGVAIQNLGFAVPLVKESFGFPLLFRLGADYHLGQEFLFTTEMDMPNDNDFVVGVGAEMNFQKYVFLRMGYRYDSIFNPFSAGLGFKMNSAMLDLVWVPAGELGQTYRGSLGYRWGGWVSEDKNADLRVLSGIMARGPGIPKPRAFLLQPMVKDPKLVKSWTVEFRGAGPSGMIQKTVSGLGTFGAEVSWDGNSEQGAPAADGDYDAVLKVQLIHGENLASLPQRLLLNPPLPDSFFEIDPNSIAPGTDTIYVPTDIHVKSAVTALPIRWRMVWTGPDQKVFHTVEGELGAPLTFQWSGANAKGEQFYSNTVYELKMSLIDAKGNVVKEQPPISRRCVFRR